MLAQAMKAQLPQAIEEIGNADELNGAHGGDVQAVAERIAQAHGAVMAAAVVAVGMLALTDRLPQGRILQQGGCGPATLQRQGVEERLEGGTGLARHRHRIISAALDRKSTRLNSSHVKISYAV